MRQVCHTGFGETWAFPWQLLLLFSPHGWSPVTRSRRDIKPKQQYGQLPVCRAGICRDRRFPSLRAHRQPLDCQAVYSTAAILWRKKSPYRFNGLRGFPRKGTNKASVRLVYTSFPNLYGLQRGVHVSNSESNLSFILVPFAPCFYWCVRDNQHHAAPTWPDSSDRAEVEAHTGSYLFILRHC